MTEVRAGRPRVLVVGLGGTISMTSTAAGGVAPALSPEQLLAAVPGLSNLDVDLAAVEFRRLPGASLTLDDIAALAGLLRHRLALSEVDGVVVVQGTDTIEETAYLLDLYHGGPEPVVVTGAMRNPTMAGADGPANLLAAVQTAASGAARGLGCLVVLADEIHAARRVRKTHSTACGTFQSPNGGPVGYVVEGQPRLLVDRLPRTAVPSPTESQWEEPRESQWEEPRESQWEGPRESQWEGPRESQWEGPAESQGEGRRPRVAVVPVSLGDDGVLLAGLAGRVDGVVVAGFGAGHVPEQMLPLLQELVDAVPVVLASRTGAGPVLTATYGFPGSERDLVNRGLIPAGFLDPFKARILLYALLAAGLDRETIAAAFAAAPHPSAR